jgi:hypothetical protein
MSFKSPAKTIAHKDPKLPAPLAVSEHADWAGNLASLTAADAETLVAVIRTLYPHDHLPITLYRRVVLHFDRLNLPALFENFCAELNAGWALPFRDLAESYRVQILKSLEPTKPFFFIQRMAVRYLYDDIEIWAAFGYEGASVHLGGYLKRGFDDLDWLPPLPDDL